MVESIINNYSSNFIDLKPKNVHHQKKRPGAHHKACKIENNSYIAKKITDFRVNNNLEQLLKLELISLIKSHTDIWIIDITTNTLSEDKELL